MGEYNPAERVPVFTYIGRGTVWVERGTLDQMTPDEIKRMQDALRRRGHAKP